MGNPENWKDGFCEKEVAVGWIEHIENADEPLRERSIYPFIRDWYRRNGMLSGVEVVDLCCGQGASSVVVKELGAKVTGVDYSEPLITRAQDGHGISGW